MAKKKKKDDSGGHLIVMLTSTGVAFLVRKVLATGWTKVTGKQPPIDLTDPRVTLVEALGWAALLGVTVETARFYIIRATAKRTLPGAGETE
jgi:hypothetical protein